MQDRYEQWAIDAGSLRELGQHLFYQDLRVELRLPRATADEALAAWQREDDEQEPSGETAEQRMVRDQAASLALIGLAVDETGIGDGDEVIAKVDAWLIGKALSAAVEAGLFKDLTPPL